MSAQQEFCLLANKCLPLSPLTGIEIGTASGIWTQYVLRNLNIKHLYTIDPYKHFPDEAYEGGRPQEWHNKILASADKKLSQFTPKILTRLFLTSEEAFHWFVDRQVQVDFVYIDGNHNEEYIRYDIWHYWKFIKSYGIFAGHDYNLRQVRNAVTDFFGPTHNVIEKERVWWVLKSKNMQTENLSNTSQKIQNV